MKKIMVLVAFSTILSLASCNKNNYGDDPKDYYGVYMCTSSNEYRSFVVSNDNFFAESSGSGLIGATSTNKAYYGYNYVSSDFLKKNVTVPSYDAGYPGIAVWNNKEKSNAYVFYRLNSNTFEITLSDMKRIQFTKVNDDIPEYLWSDYAKELPSITLNTENFEIISNLKTDKKCTYSNISIEITANQSFDMTNAPFIPSINQYPKFDSCTVVNKEWLRKYSSITPYTGEFNYFIMYDHTFPSTFATLAFDVNGDFELNNVYMWASKSYSYSWVKMTVSPIV